MAHIPHKHSYRPYHLLIHLLSFILFATILFGCDKQDSIKIGFVGDLTGTMSKLGINGRNGVLIAVEERNEIGGINGHTIDLIAKDDKHLPEQALKVDQELINEGVVAIIGHMTSTMSEQVVPLMNKEKMVMISPTTSKLSGIDDYFIRIQPYGKANHQVAKYAYTKLGVKNLAIVYDLSNAAFSELIQKDFTTEMETLGGSVTLSMPYSSGSDVGYNNIVNELLKSEPDGLLIVSGPLDTAMICQHLRMAGSQIPILLKGWVGVQELIKHGGPAVEGAIFSVMFNQDNQDPTYLDFKNRYHKRFGTYPDFASAYSYEAAQLLFNALSKDMESKNLKETILNLPKLDGPQGAITFDKYGDAQRKEYIVAIQDRRIVVLE